MLQYSEDRWYAVCYYLILISIWRYLHLCVYVRSGKEMDCKKKKNRILFSTESGNQYHHTGNLAEHTEFFFQKAA
jgi:hypothetical protein